MSDGVLLAVVSPTASPGEFRAEVNASSFVESRWPTHAMAWLVHQVGRYTMTLLYDKIVFN